MFVWVFFFFLLAFAVRLCCGTMAVLKDCPNNGKSAAALWNILHAELSDVCWAPSPSIT